MMGARRNVVLVADEEGKRDLEELARLASLQESLAQWEFSR